MKTTIKKICEPRTLFLIALNVMMGVTPLALADTFTTIDFPDALSTTAHGINARGDIVGFHAFVPIIECQPQIRLCHGFLLSGGEFAAIDFPGAHGTLANGINARGDIVGRYLGDDGLEHGYVLSGGQFTTIDFPGAIFTNAIGINPRGDIVGSYRGADNVSHGFLLRGGQFTSIDFPGAASSFAFRINPRRDIVGRYIGADGLLHGYMLSR